MKSPLSFAGLRLSAGPFALPSFLGLWLLLSALLAYLFSLPWQNAVWTGLLCTFCHFGSVYWHDFGHAIASRGVGYPMTGIHLHGVLATTLYPTDEPTLSAAIHIRRALGGPIASAILAGIALALWWGLTDGNSILRLVSGFLWLENLFVFTLQIVVPLGFNDGGTILHWLRK